MSETLTARRLTTAVRERPFIAKPWEVRALLDNRMTQFRRPIKPQPEACDHTDWPEYPRPDWQCDSAGWYCAVCGNGVRLTRDDVAHIRCPFGSPGDVLWLKETWAHIDGRYETPEFVVYRADESEAGRVLTEARAWHSSAIMPRWASRLTLEIVDVKVERVCEISREDIEAQGCPWKRGDGPWDDMENALKWFQKEWERDFPNHPWESSWAWAVTFRPIDKEAPHAR